MTEDRLSVLGTAVGELSPDRVEWTLVVREADADARAAFARCAERLRALADTLTMADVATGAVTVSPEWHTHGHKLTGRQMASGALTAVSPIALGGEVAAAAMEGGADGLHGPDPLLPDEREARDALFAAAVRNARATAEGMAAAAGRSLGRVVSVRDPRADESDGVEYAVAASGRGGHDGPPVIARPQRISAAVAVVFELRD